jgi:hypothetical protein
LKFVFNISAILLFTSISIAKAQDNNDPYYEVSNIYHERAGAFACEFINEKIKEINEKKESDVKNEIQEEINQLSHGLDEKLTTSEKRDLKHSISLLKKSKKLKSSKKFVITQLEKICHITKQNLYRSSRVVSLANSVVVNLAAAPFGGLISFFRGVFTHKIDHLKPRNDFLYRAMGPKKGIPLYLLSNLTSAIPNMILNVNPFLYLLNVNIGIEMITNYRCFNRNQLNLEQNKFCENYDQLKDFFYKWNEVSFNAGKKVQKLLDKKLILKREQLSNKEFCELPFKKQIKMARKTLSRNPFFLNNDKITKSDIILPAHKNKCTKLLVYAASEENLQFLNEQKEQIEGIQIVYLLENQIPIDQYFSTTEFNNLPLEEQICHDIVALNLSKYTKNNIHLVGEMVKASMAQSLLSSPQFNPITIDNSKIVKGTVQGLKNLIFIISPDEKELKENMNLKLERTEIIKEIKKTYKRLTKSDSVSSCLQKIKSLNVDISQFNQKMKRLNEINSHRGLRKELEQKAIKKFFKKNKYFLSLSWELIETNNLQNITSSLQSREIGNIVIVSHGKSSGHLVDSSNQELPKEAFSSISPSILSLNFYSCHSQQLIELYNLVPKIQSQESFYKIRELTTVKQNDFMNSDHFAPIAGFGDYLFQLDQRLKRSSKGAQLLQKEFQEEFKDEKSLKMCGIDISDIKVSRGGYALTMNNQFIGTFSSENNEGMLSFPCHYLNPTNNKLQIKNIINSGGSIIENLNSFDLVIQGKNLNSSSATIKQNSLVIFKFDFNDSQDFSDNT